MVIDLMLYIAYNVLFVFRGVSMGESTGMIKSIIIFNRQPFACNVLAFVLYFIS